MTSAGFENKAIENIYLELIGKKPEEIKALFIPTAAVYPDAIAMLPKCMDDLHLLYRINDTNWCWSIW